MENKYAECHKPHEHLAGKTNGCLDGCQEYMETSKQQLECLTCGCHRNFHRRVKPPVIVVYTTCHKIHDFQFKSCVDGCQEFIPIAEQGAGMVICATCGCNKGFHRNEVTIE